MRKYTIVTLILLILCLNTAIFAGADDDSEKNLYWVYFTDKEFVQQGAPLPADIEITHLTDRALNRREMRSSIGLLTYYDVDIAASYIEEIENLGLEIRTKSRWLNAISILATEGEIVLLNGKPHIRGTSRVRKVSKRAVKKISRDEETLLDSGEYGYSFEQLQQINAIAAHDSGFTGAGVLVLMLDTGYRTDHEAFSGDRILAERDFIQDDSITTNQEGDHANQHNHGTMTATTLGGFKDSILVGVAYECDFLLAKTEILDQEIEIEEDLYVAGLEWGEALGADVSSSSLGYLDWYTYEDLTGNLAVTTIAIDIAVSLGLACVTAAGNEGSNTWHYIIAPADADSVISVGAVNSQGTIASFSSYGPSADGRIKPEVCAQGVSTFTASAASPNAYTAASGTSLATPLVGGAVALIIQAHPDWTPMEVREALMMTASQNSSPDNHYGFGIIDIIAAINYNQDMNYGDLNLDGNLNIHDVVLAVEWTMNLSTLNANQIQLLDLNFDQAINVLDIVILIDWVLTF